MRYPAINLGWDSSHYLIDSWDTSHYVLRHRFPDGGHIAHSFRQVLGLFTIS